jgi:hypothetical protein
MKRNTPRIILLFSLALSFQVAHAQLFKFGVHAGPHYSFYGLSQKPPSSAIEVISGAPGGHSGIFVRRDYNTFYAGAELNYSAYLGGTIDDGNSTFKLETGSVNMPIYFGKNFYPGIRVFGGGMPAVFIKHNDTELQSYLENSPAMQSTVGGSQNRNDFVFHMVAGAGFEFLKFFIEVRYEHPLDYFIQEDFSTGGTVTNIDNMHYLYQVSLSIGYWFN